MKFWFNKTLGNLLLKEETRNLREFLEQIFGYHLLQLGGWVRSDFLEASPIGHKIYFNTEDGATILGKFDELPFLPNSIDLVIIPHVLEFEKHPKKILNEVYQILIPGGSVIIIGFNPFSLLGLIHFFKNKFISCFRMRRWLVKIGFQFMEDKTFFFRLPVQNNYLLQKMLFMERLGQMLWPFCGGVYILAAKKAIAALTPIKVKQRLVKERAAAPTAYVKPTNWESNEKS